MTRTGYLLAILLTALGTATAGEVAAERDDAATLESKVQTVTVYADRARVTRVGKAKAPAGAARLAFRKLPGWIDDGSVRVSILPVGAAELQDVQVKRTFLAKPSDEEFRKAELSVREIADQIAALDDEQSILESQVKQVDSIRAFSGEGFALFLGVEDRLKVSRELDRKRSSLELGSKRTRGVASYVVTAENVSDRPITVQIVNHVPVSESTNVKVSNLHILPECRPDAQGLVRWEVTLAPKEKRELRLEYTLEYPTEWANTIREQYKAGKKSEVRIEEQIFEFQSKF